MGVAFVVSNWVRFAKTGKENIDIQFCPKRSSIEKFMLPVLETLVLRFFQDSQAAQDPMKTMMLIDRMVVIYF